jgi:chemotaxis protein methyltransferase WspC
MHLAKIKQLLNDRIGLNPDSVGESSIKRAVSQRMTALKVKNHREYFKILSDQLQEINELIEEVVVPETWFFRNKTPFDALRSYVKNDVIPGLKSSEKVRILSVPCSTGEEPYSIAMALLEEKVDARKISIDAVDISKKALMKARRAIYGRNSFRDVDEKIIGKYFDKIHSGQYLIEKVRNLVDFKQGNFLVGSLSPHPGYYDVIFCRNLLIYFNREIQQKALEKLHRALKDSGVLFVGHAETAALSRNGFAKYEHPHSFAYLKKGKDHSGKNKNKIASSVGDGLPKKVPKEWEQVFQQFAQMPHFSPPTKTPVKNKKTRKLLPVRRGRKNIALESVEQLIGEGRYDQALRQCEQYLKTARDSADGYFLLGVIYRSSGNDKKSQSMLKKAIYLDPNHEQAIALSLRLAEERNDKDAIVSYKRRLRRVRERLKKN